MTAGAPAVSAARRCRGPRMAQGVLLAGLALLMTAPSAAPAAVADSDRDRRLPPILAPDLGGAQGDLGRIVPRRPLPPEPVAGTPGRSALGALFRAAEGTAPPAGGFTPPTLAPPAELRKRLALPDFSQPLPPPWSGLPGQSSAASANLQQPPLPQAPVSVARPDASAHEQPYASRLLGIPRSVEADAAAPSRPALSHHTERAIARAAEAAAEAAVAGRAEQAGPRPQTPPGVPDGLSAGTPRRQEPGRQELVIDFVAGSAAVPTGALRALSSFAALAARQQGRLVRMRIAAPAELDPTVGIRLADARARALRLALAERRIQPDRIAFELVAADGVGRRDATLELLASADPGS